LTTAKYYTPSHKVIHGEGITPDCPVPMSDDEELAVSVRQRRPSLDTMDEKERDLILTTHDPQLERAEDLLKGILIYAHRTPPDHRIASKAREPETSASK
jgi:carboxyl-terminal processing protease